MRYKIRMSVILEPEKASMLAFIIPKLRESWTKDFKDLIANKGMVSVKNLEKPRNKESILKLANTLALNNGEGTIIALGDNDQLYISIKDGKYKVEQKPLSEVSK